MTVPMRTPEHCKTSAGPRAESQGAAGAAASAAEDGAWVIGHQSAVWRWLRWLGAAPSVAEDLLQETLMAGLGNPERRQWTHEQARRWLCGTARNLFLMHLRSSQRRERRERGDPQLLAAATSSQVAPDEIPARLAALAHCLKQLPQRSRRALELRYGEDAGRDAMSRELGVRPEGVKSLLQRIRAALRTCMRKAPNPDCQR